MRRHLSWVIVLCVAVAAVTVLPSAAMAQLPGEWQYNPATDHYYLMVHDGLPWVEAEQLAIAHHGHLVTINDAEEAAWLYSTFDAPYWIGMNDIDQEGNWVWSSGEPVTFTDWHDGQPDNSGIGQDWYVDEDAANVEFDGDLGWNDIPAEDSMPFVIEKIPSLVTPEVTLTLSGLKRGVLKLGRRVTAKGTVAPASLAGSRVALTVQKKKSARWVKVKTAARTIQATSTYSWKYKPTAKGTYRVRTTIAKTATNTAAKTPWRTFRVR